MTITSPVADPLSCSRRVPSSTAVVAPSTRFPSAPTATAPAASPTMRVVVLTWIGTAAVPSARFGVERARVESATTTR